MPPPEWLGRAAVERRRCARPAGSMEQADLRHHPLRDRRHGGLLHELEIFRQRETVATDPHILRMGGEIVGRRPAEEKQGHVVVASHVDLLRHARLGCIGGPPTATDGDDHLREICKPPAHERQGCFRRSIRGICDTCHFRSLDHRLVADRVPGRDVDTAPGRVLGVVPGDDEHERRFVLGTFQVALRLREEDIPDRRMTPMNDRAAFLEDLAGQQRHEVTDPLPLLGLHPGRHSPGKPDPHSGEG